ncbi:Toxin YafO, type II toxin-antitoxin system [Azotobacter beijerinckii]|uniref:Toxin YafO, type II toxin-antitoxin system n=1 Tax=Azotobacter beijerinckii TaxID=170623 RepID=A0A1H9MN51_9GAMM|nr:type II toxin-antitoxin system YafO family toxin [Azotobacter beijerinckii]SER25048.1 Toxin YafO, type II toxin-antitoxin system [Azotobacter beijerinckii]
MPSVKVSDLFKESEGWYRYYADFYNNKLFGDLPDDFGRDEGLDLDYLHHIHLAMTAKLVARWKIKRRQFDRTTDPKDPANDYWLVYAYDDLRDEYLLLTILGPNAHSRPEWGAFLRTVAHDIVEPWIQGRVVYTDPDE